MGLSLGAHFSALAVSVQGSSLRVGAGCQMEGPAPFHLRLRLALGSRVWTSSARNLWMVSKIGANADATER